MEFKSAKFILSCRGFCPGRVILIITVGMIALILSLVIYDKYEKEQIIFEAGGFESYPKSASGYRMSTTGGMFGGRQFFVNFQADGEDIRKWLGDNTLLKTAKSNVYNDQYRLLPYDEHDPLTNDFNRMEKVDFHFPSDNKPAWINNLKISNGVKYEYSNRGFFPATLYADFDTNNVYLIVALE